MQWENSGPQRPCPGGGAGLSRFKTMDNGSKKSTLKQACLDEAKQRFTQAARSPLLQLPPTTGLGSLQIGSEAFLQILDGTFPYEQISDEYMRKLLHQLQKPAQFCKVSPRTDGKYKTGWQRARETTLSSLSGVHFGHYIAGVEAALTEKINRLMATIPLLTGISPERWRHTLNVMLEKVAGNCAVEKL